jgi:hypothetical protein
MIDLYFLAFSEKKNFSGVQYAMIKIQIARNICLYYAIFVAIKLSCNCPVLVVNPPLIRIPSHSDIKRGETLGHKLIDEHGHEQTSRHDRRNHDRVFNSRSVRMIAVYCSMLYR